MTGRGGALLLLPALADTTVKKQMSREDTTRNAAVVRWLAMDVPDVLTCPPRLFIPEGGGHGDRLLILRGSRQQPAASCHHVQQQLLGCSIKSLPPSPPLLEKLRHFSSSDQPRASAAAISKTTQSTQTRLASSRARRSHVPTVLKMNETSFRENTSSATY